MAVESVFHRLVTFSEHFQFVEGSSVLSSHGQVPDSGELHYTLVRTRPHWVTGKASVSRIQLLVTNLKFSLARPSVNTVKHLRVMMGPHPLPAS